MVGGRWSVVGGRRPVPESHGPSERHDLAGVAFVTGGVVALVWALNRAGDAGWASAEVGGSLVAGCLLPAAFVWWEHRAADAMVRPRLFASRDFAIGNLTTFLMSGAIFAGGLLVTEEFRLGRHFSPVGVGAPLLPFFATAMLVSPIAGAISDRIGRAVFGAYGALRNPATVTAGFRPALAACALWSEVRYRGSRLQRLPRWRGRPLGLAHRGRRYASYGA